MYQKPVTPEEQRMAVAEHMRGSASLSAANMVLETWEIEFALSEALAAHGLTIVEMPVG